MKPVGVLAFVSIVFAAQAGGLDDAALREGLEIRLDRPRSSALLRIRRLR